jgi:DinB superfamily
VTQSARPSPDPVQKPNEYQALLLSVLGERDPGEVYEQLDAQTAAMVSEAGDRLRIRPAEGEWSVLELLGHLADAELMVGSRCRSILGQDRPPLPGYDQETWVERQRHNEADPDQLLTLLAALRASNLRLWRGASDQDRARLGIHAERGPESFDLTFRLGAGHGLLHLEQMRDTLAAIRTT